MVLGLEHSTQTFIATGLFIGFILYIWLWLHDADAAIRITEAVFKGIYLIGRTIVMIIVKVITGIVKGIIRLFK